MVWGAISWWGTGQLVVCPGPINSVEYVQILGKGLLPTLEDLPLEQQDIVFQHDNAPPHTSRPAKSGLQKTHCLSSPGCLIPQISTSLKTSGLFLNTVFKIAAHIPQISHNLLNISRRSGTKSLLLTSAISTNLFCTTLLPLGAQMDCVQTVRILVGVFSFVPSEIALMRKGIGLANQ